MREEHRLNLTMDQALQRLESSAAPRRTDLSSELIQSSEEWDLNTTFQMAVSLARNGWLEHIPEVSAYLEEVTSLVHSHALPTLDVTGESIDMGRYLDGEPECMWGHSYEPPQMVRIVCNISARCDADARLLANRGIAVAAAVYALQCSGVGVTLVAGEWVSGKEDNSLFETTVEVNSIGEYIDPGKLAFWISHPAALRRCLFRYQEQMPERIREKFGFYSYRGYGTPANPPKDCDALRGAVYLPFPDRDSLHKYKTKESALRHIRDLLKEQGVSVAVDI
jgi:hypothetical protein